MEKHPINLDFSLQKINSSFGYAKITIPKIYVSRLYTQASFAQQSSINTQGFSKGSTPLAYIEKNFQPHLLEHLKEFLLKYFVLNWLYKEIKQRKIFLAGEPRLTDIDIQPNQDAHYNFSLTLSQPISLQGWKRLLFKAPKRKKYKDLDKQVKRFLSEEQKKQKDYSSNGIDKGDWVYFSLTLLDHDHNPVFDDYKEHLWIRIGKEEADAAYQNLFIGRNIGETFISQSQVLQEYFSSHIETNYPFKVTIIDFTPYAFFAVDHLKKHFKIRNNQEVHQKLIEVFSYRNDISQRRATTEEALQLQLSKHLFDVPNHLILRKQKELLDIIFSNPDYHVYKSQDDFEDRIKKLAIKQVQEVIFTHQLAFYENITITKDDMKAYLNLTKRPRMKEFIHFELPNTKYLGQEAPFPSILLEQYCLREKTLNHMIYHLIKQKAQKT